MSFRNDDMSLLSDWLKSDLPCFDWLRAPFSNHQFENLPKWCQYPNSNPNPKPRRYQNNRPILKFLHSYTVMGEIWSFLVCSQFENTTTFDMTKFRPSLYVFFYFGNKKSGSGFCYLHFPYTEEIYTLGFSSLFLLEIFFFGVFF